MSDVCPNGCDLTGEPIPAEYIEAGYYAPGATHYSRKIGYVERGAYDGVILWICPDCGIEWPRFDKGSPLWFTALEIINQPKKMGATFNV